MGIFAQQAPPATSSRHAYRWRLAQQPRQFGEVHCHPPRFVQTGKANDTPEKLDTPGKRALYNNLNQNEVLALQIDATVRQVRPNAFRGNQARENVIKAALLPLLGNDPADVERIFLIVKAQPEY